MNIWMNQGLKDNKEKVAIPSMLSTSENIQVALRYAQCTSIDKNPVLIVFLSQNIYGNSFKRMGSSNYSAYPDEKEMLFVCP